MTTDNFLSDFQDDDFEDEVPDWMQATDEDQEEDEFDQLRRKSARSGSTYSDMVPEEDGETNTTSSSFSLSSFTPGQRLILAVLVLLNIVMASVGLLFLRSWLT